jgi:hypothetical protein
MNAHINCSRLQSKAPATLGLVLLVLMGLVPLGGCATAPSRGSLTSGGGSRSRSSSFRYGSARLPEGPSSSSSQEVLAPFLGCTSPAEFL